MTFLNKEEYLQNIPELCNLFGKCFNKEILPEYLKWRYVDNPVNDMLVCVEFDSDKIIANYSASPCIIKNNEKIVKTALSMTTMTDPDYAGRGFFTKLATNLYQNMEDKGYSLIWGFPNVNSHRAFNSRLVWKDIYEIPTMNFKVDPNKIKLDDASDICWDNSFELNYENITVDSALLSVEKDQSYLKWRYGNNPVNKYLNMVIKSDQVVSSYCILKHYLSHSLDIVDLQVKDKSDGRNLINNVIKYAVESGVENINCWAPRHHFMHPIYEKFGFTNCEPITYFGARALNENKDKIDFLNYNSWYIQMGDSDVY